MASIEGGPQPEPDHENEGKGELTFLNGVITVVERHDDYMAYVGGDTRVWSAGRNPDEAVGQVIRTHPDYVIEAIRYQAQE
jgi:cephalosporin hydroxylase